MYFLLLLPGCVNGAVRLVGGASASEGRVEFCSDQQWGTVCHDFWGEPDARVVCRQLGFSTIGKLKLTTKMSVSTSNFLTSFLIASGATAVSNAFYGAGSGNIYLDNVACNGNEANISSCTADFNTADCTHSQDAGVTCNAERGFLNCH